jgi:hypothetical protein
MAVSLTATISISNSSIVNGQVVDGVLGIFNTGTTPTNLLSVQLQNGSEIVNSGSGNSMALPALNWNGPGVQTTIPAISGNVAGSLYIPFQTTAYCGIQNTSSSFEFAFGLTAIILTSDGSMTTSSTATMQDVAPQTASQSPGALPYTPSSGPLSSSTATIPLPGAPPNTPVVGQLRFDSNLETLLVLM